MPGMTRKEPKARKKPKTPRKSEVRKGPRATPPSQAHRERWTGWGLFLLAFVLRLFFWQATPDAHWPHSAYYKGDAVTWLNYAASLQADQPFELGLPLRPPGNAYLIAALWNGREDGIPALKMLWCLLGALIVWCVHGAVRQEFGPRPALGIGLLCAGSSGLMMLSTSLNNETPYLILVALTFRIWPHVRRGDDVRLLALWGASHALACLFRVEHALYFALLLLWQGISVWRREGLRPSGLRLLPTALAALLVLAPWHVKAWQACYDFNHTEPEVNPATEQAFQQIEAALAGISWEPEAQEALQELPAQSRRTMEHFVAATVAVRGGRTVSADDLQVMDEAFGSRPSRLSEHPFVALYGGLNFYLANNVHAPAGFGRGPLDAPPPLEGGRSRFPAMLVAGLPPPDLALTYPPHLDAVNRGYSHGWQWIRDHPAEFLRLAGQKLSVFWAGATPGFSGYVLPLGLEGPRRRVDLVTPSLGLFGTLWQGLWFLFFAVGLWLERRRLEALIPWLAFLASKLAATVFFFGYARQGASVFLVVALGASLAFAHLLTQREGATGQSLLRRGPWVVAGVLLALEILRWVSPPDLYLDGRPVTSTPSWPVEIHEDRTLTLEP